MCIYIYVHVHRCVYIYIYMVLIWQTKSKIWMLTTKTLRDMSDKVIWSRWYICHVLKLGEGCHSASRTPGRVWKSSWQKVGLWSHETWLCFCQRTRPNCAALGRKFSHDLAVLNRLCSPAFGFPRNTFHEIKSQGSLQVVHLRVMKGRIDFNLCRQSLRWQNQPISMCTFAKTLCHAFLYMSLCHSLLRFSEDSNAMDLNKKPGGTDFIVIVFPVKLGSFMDSGDNPPN